MPANNSRTSALSGFILFLVVGNIAILKYAYTQDASLYKLLFLGLPLQLIAVIYTRLEQRKTRQSEPQEWVPRSGQRGKVRLFREPAKLKDETRDS